MQPDAEASSHARGRDTLTRPKEASAVATLLLPHCNEALVDTPAPPKPTTFAPPLPLRSDRSRRCSSTASLGAKLGHPAQLSNVLQKAVCETLATTSIALTFVLGLNPPLFADISSARSGLKLGCDHAP